MKQTLNVCIHKNIHKNNLHKHIQSNNIVQFDLYRILRYFLYFVFLEKLVLQKDLILTRFDGFQSVFAPNSATPVPRKSHLFSPTANLFSSERYD